MRKKYSIIIVIIILATIVFFIAKSNANSQQACIENKACFDIEIVDSDEELVLGLSNRNQIPESQGMLFVLSEESAPRFWMKSMRFPIDIIWINSEMRVSGIVRDFQPCEPDGVCPVVYPDEEISYVFEINSGLSDAYGFEEGDRVYLK